FVENSSATNLDFRAHPDLSSASGSGGTLLLDPSAITIVGGSGDGATDGTSTFAGSPSGTTGSVLFSDTGPTTIYQSELQSLPPSTNIVLQATDFINASSSFGGTLLLSPGSNLTLTTRNASSDSVGTKGINLTTSSDGVNLIIATQGGSITMQTGTGSSPQAADINAIGLSTNGGAVNLSASGSVNARGIVTSPTAGSGGSIGITAGSYINAGSTLDARNASSGTPGIITLNSIGGAIAAYGSVYASSLNLAAAGGIDDGSGGPMTTQVSTLTASNTGAGAINISNSGTNLLIAGVSQSANGGITIVNTMGYNISLSGAISTQNGLVVLQADTMSLSGGTINTNSSAPITLEPSTGGRLIDIGGTAGQFPSSLQLTISDLGAALPSGGMVAIGNPNAGGLTVDSSWSQNLAQVTLTSGGSITVSQGLAVTGGNVALNGASGIAVNGAITVPGTMTMVTSGSNVTETGSISAANLTANMNGSSATGGIALTAASNAIGALGPVTASAFSLNNGGHAITLGNPFTLNLPSPPAAGQTYTLIENAAPVSGALTPTQVNGLTAGQTANFTYPVGQAILTIYGSPGLSLTLSGGAAYASYGETLSYTSTLTNGGTAAATNTGIDFGLSTGLDAANATWSCSATGGANCPANSSASMTVPSLPAGGTITWTLHVAVQATAVDSTATVQASLNGMVQASDTAVLVIFQNGFD
ncbi:MAG TPA: hypothetical protein VL425_06430, partial [Rudaea sp.]|nr:hypothetical protein [Rudaea sp.]